MKLTAFRIKNFRSIRDTGWHDLAYDNITCLIGQNESGKTSVLEGLKAFYDGELIEDMLRSDLSLPVVSCRFQYKMEEIQQHLQIKRIHPEILKLLEKLNTVSIRRIWESDLTSYITTGEELEEIYRVEEEEKAQREQDVKNHLHTISNEAKKASLAVNKVRENAGDIEDKIRESESEYNAKKKKSRSFFSKEKNVDSESLMALADDIQELKNKLEEKELELKERQEVVQSFQEKIDLASRLDNLKADIQLKKKELSEARENLVNIANIVGILPSEKEMLAAETKEEQLKLEIELARDELKKSRRKYDLMLLTAEKYFGGKSYRQANDEAKKELSEQDVYLGPSELGEELYKLAPEFEMFEDFSSLLPNRIDLEDILTGNSSAEGYKAAVNFLTITGLDYNFFQQPSSRILKQKIENLNGELTLNFQDFWRQNVGKNNKIKINFELAHYDHSHVEKSGLPFIEFWIKDESERLYPKQRSRGVRWFLSFFMELKATAVDQTRRKRILLIDEPGVSLHARAQEDVLKVFDDIKEHIQIIYSTHSPHLIDVNKLYRVIAVQRAVEDDMNSETVLLNARSLKSATADTLSPVYAMMGARLNQQDIIKAYNNVIVKDLATHYFLKAIVQLTGCNKKECFFVPASGASSIPMIINILIGWGLEYIALNFGNDEEKYIYNKLRKELFENQIDLANSQLLFLSEFRDVEDLFSTIDFKKHIVRVREGITVPNSEYLRDNNHSRAVLASNFLQKVNRKEITLKDLDEESVDNLKMLVNNLSALLK